MVAAQSDVAVGGATPFALTAVETNPAGYSLTFCYVCTVSPVGGGATIEFFKDSITVTQNTLDCSIALTDAGFIDPAPIPYNSAGSYITIAPEYTSIFNHINSADCPILSCASHQYASSLGSDLCSSTPYSFSPYIEINPALPYEIIALETMFSGYSYTFCFICALQSDLIISKVITVVQNPLDCTSALSDAGFASPAAIPYDFAGSPVSIAIDYTAIFNHVSDNECPLVECVMKESGCGTILPS